MYNSFFGFTENPFNLTPDPRYLFLSPYHKEALDHLLYGINERKGFITITGGIGNGKTTLCRVLLNHLDSSTKSALIFNAFVSDIELLKTINQEFGIDMDPTAETKKDYIDALNHFLLDIFSSGSNAVLLIDEAQNLSNNVLEQIRMLSNLETEKEKLIQIVLVGQSELKEILSAPSIRQLDERIMVRYDLKPLTFQDIRGYIGHRLVVAGGRGDLRFTMGAFKKIYAYSQGNPRRINTVCDRALLIAYTEEKHIISKTIIEKVIKELQADKSAIPQVGSWTWKRYVSFSLLLLLLVMVAGLGGWSFRENILKITAGNQKTDVTKIKDTTLKDPKPKQEQVTLFLDKKTSLSGLFSLFNSRTREEDQVLYEPRLSLVRFNIESEYHVMLKKPFRVYLSEPANTELGVPHFLLIRKTTEKGAIAIDAEGKERPVTRDFILKHWGKKVSWVYPSEIKELILLRGMSIPEVLKVQNILSAIGYMVKPTGIYDESTFQQAMKYQRDFGLLDDGIIGPRTMALLYQMVVE